MEKDTPQFGRRSLAPTAEQETVTSIATAPPSSRAPRVTFKMASTAKSGEAISEAVIKEKEQVKELLFGTVDMKAMLALPKQALKDSIRDLVTEIIKEKKINLNQDEIREMARVLIDEMMGLGPLEPLLADPTINDIMVNRYDQVYVERNGRMELTNVAFNDNRHVLHVAYRIASRVNRRVDESSPLVDARLDDGSRVNIIIPPLALDGPMISIRKFSAEDRTLDMMVQSGSISDDMRLLLSLAVKCKQNILISGGTGSGKTTLLNALSRYIDPSERILTIEDAAELRLQQPHVGRLETRPANIEGVGAITARDLLKNALRMRPDRIILGEVRGEEVIDMLQAMNTGHEGSLGTLHANSPREALVRLENMLEMSGMTASGTALKRQIMAVNLIVQVERMRDGHRRVTHITEIKGMNDGVISSHDLAEFKFDGFDVNGRIQGQFEFTGMRPGFEEVAGYYGAADDLNRLMKRTIGLPD